MSSIKIKRQWESDNKVSWLTPGGNYCEYVVARYSEAVACDFVRQPSEYCKTILDLMRAGF